MRKRRKEIYFISVFIFLTHLEISLSLTLLTFAETATPSTAAQPTVRVLRMGVCVRTTGRAHARNSAMGTGTGNERWSCVWTCGRVSKLV